MQFAKCPFLYLFGQPAAGDPDHGPTDHRLVMFGQAFVVAYTSAMSCDPGQSPLDHPTPRQDHKPDRIIRTLHDPHRDLQGRARPIQEFAGIATISPDQPDAMASASQPLQQRASTITILNRGCGDQHTQQQSQGVHGDVAFATVDLLPFIPVPG